jgi:ABC-type phosphate transport system permease subunit
MSTAKSNHNPAAIAIAKRQHVFDFLFKYLTQSFALIVLFALLGIILSLIINAYPALNKFGFGFFRSHTAFSTKDPETRASTSQIRDYANINKRLYHSYSYQFNSMRV